MMKRFILAVILMSAYQQYIFILPLLVFEIIFFILRFIIEKPDTTKEKITMLLETVFLIGSYLLMFLCIDAGVNTIIISIIVFIFIVMLGYDLTTIYL